MNTAQWNNLVHEEFERQNAEYAIECAKARENAIKGYNLDIASGKLPEDTQEKRIQMAVSLVERPMSREQIEAMYAFLQDTQPITAAPVPEIPDLANAFYETSDGKIYSVADQAFVETAANPIKLNGGIATLVRTLDFYGLPIGDCLLTPEQLANKKRDAIDYATSLTILAGFDYDINGETLHFSYDMFDQQNFADTANACLMKKAGAEGLPDSINWNANKHTGELVRLTLTPDEFLALYAGGALNHKAVCMELGGQKKAELV